MPSQEIMGDLLVNEATWGLDVPVKPGFAGIWRISWGTGFPLAITSITSSVYTSEEWRIAEFPGGKCGRKPRQNRCAKIRTTLCRETESKSLAISQNKGWSHCITVHSLLSIRHHSDNFLSLPHKGRSWFNKGLWNRRAKCEEISQFSHILSGRSAFLEGGVTHVLWWCNTPVLQWRNTAVLQLLAVCVLPS